MSAAEHLYRIASTGWVHCHGSTAQDVPAWPRLEHAALVVLDLDDVFTDVWRFEGKAEYAAAMIEKRVRTEGLVEGTAHVVIHRLIKVPRGFQAFFSAISLDFWQQCSQWARDQADHCLVLMAPGLLCHGVDNDKARLMLSQRRLMCFAQTEAGMAFGSTQALGSDPLAVASAAKVLAANVSTLLTRMEPEAVQWGTLWTDRTGDQDSCLEVVHGVLGFAPAVMRAQELDLADERVHTVMPELAHKAAGRQALNPAGERIAWRAERWVVPITMVTALVGVVLVGVGALVTQQVHNQRMAGQGQRAELQALQSRIEAVASVQAPDKLLPATELARRLDQGMRYDPMTFLAELKAATADRRLQIQRVRLDSEAQSHTRTFRVDGVAAPGASAAVVRWVSRMSAAGWTLKALDPVGTVPGAFSYQLVAASAAPGGVKP
jgi:hypothetical protein